MAEGEIVYVSLSWSYGVNVSGQIVYFGPGDRVPVPVAVARRMGWRANVVRAQTAAAVAEKAGVPNLIDALEIAGFVTAESIRDASESDLTAVSGIGKATAVKLKTAAEELLA